ncbi:MAG: class I SAM-dependent methyltransferase, partial [Altibacter sp.]|nr:class I SAM-dependent methyltransferase [Altibacter sp.]
SEVFRVKKLHANTHLYTSESLREFPGRRFTIDACVPYNKNAMKDALTVTKANIATRNFPESVAVIRKKWKLKDGGEHYLFFTTTLNDKKVLLICSKI